MQILPALVIFALMWLFLVRPQQQRVRKHRDLMASLQVGDEVVTAGGIIGEVSALEDDRAVVRVAPGVDIRMLRAAITQRVPETRAIEDDERPLETDDEEPLP